MTIGELVLRVRRRLAPPVSASPASSSAPSSPASVVPMFAEPGHYYSPIPSVADIEAFRVRAQDPRPDSLGAIDLRLDEQVALLDTFRVFYDEQPFSVERTAELRFWFDNPSFSYADALALYSMLRWLRPRASSRSGPGGRPV